MKNYIIISLITISVGFSQKEYNNNKLVEMDNGLWTLKYSREPISGKVYGLFGEVEPYKKVYMGNLRKGKREGKWVFYYQSTGKKKYEYSFKDGRQDGLFTKWSKSGKKVFTKTLKDGKKHGLYTEWWPNGKSKSYEGIFKDGFLHGIGTYSTKDGYYYSGNFEYDVIQGSGLEKQKDVYEYSGDFYGGQRQGIGKMVRGDRTIYRGSWYKGEKDGFGIEKSPDGTIYAGEWRGGYKNGRGRIEKRNKIFFYGIWIEGQFELVSTDEEITLFLINKYPLFNGFDKEI